MRTLRTAAIMAGVSIGAAGLASCTPAPILVVNSTGAGADAVPGDGVCETTTPGQCTFQAAIEEANVLGAADLTVPAGTYATTASVTGAVQINRGAPVDVRMSGLLTVAAGGTLWVEGVSASPTLAVYAYGTLTMVRVRLYHQSDNPLWVPAGGSAVLANSFVQASNGYDAIFNSGTIQAQYTTVYGDFTSGAVRNFSGGTSTWSASVLAAANNLNSCNGLGFSTGGHNLTSATCSSFNAPTDVRSTDPKITPLNSFVGLPGYTINTGSPLVDSIPVGSASCAVGLVDVTGLARPFDSADKAGNGCDRGSVERPT